MYATITRIVEMRAVIWLWVHTRQYVTCIDSEAEVGTVLADSFLERQWWRATIHTTLILYR